MYGAQSAMQTAMLWMMLVSREVPGKAQAPWLPVLLSPGKGRMQKGKESGRDVWRNLPPLRRSRENLKAFEEMEPLSHPDSLILQGVSL